MEFDVRGEEAVRVPGIEMMFWDGSISTRRGDRPSFVAVM